MGSYHVSSLLNGKKPSHKKNSWKKGGHCRSLVEKGSLMEGGRLDCLQIKPAFSWELERY